MSAGRLDEALVAFVSCGERHCATFDNGNPNCGDCTLLRGLAVQRVLGLLDNDEVHGAVADTVAPKTRYYDVVAAATLAAIRTHLTTPTKEEA